DEALDLAAQSRKVGGFGNRAVAGPFVFLGQPEVIGLVADRDAVLTEEDAEQTVEAAGDLREKRRHVGGAERNAGGLDDFPARLLDLLAVSVPGRLSPGVIRVGDMPFFAQLADQVGRE